MSEMPKTRINQKCPNCGAWLPFHQTLPGRRKCDFCGVAVPQLPPVLPPPQAEAPASAATPLTMAVLVAFFGALLAGWQFMRAKALSTPDVEVVAPVKVEPVAPAPVPIAPTPVSAPGPTEPQSTAPAPSHHSSRSHRVVAPAPHAEPCHISAMEMSQMRDRYGSQLKSCFAAALKLLPNEVGLSSDWDLGIDADGKVVRVHPHLHVLDYKRGDAQRAAAPYSAPAHDSEAVRCAVRALMGWDFGSYVPDLKKLKDRLPNLEMTCELTLGLADP